ncbi:MAG: Jag N-terminal domain-containing protein, partial [Chloroflexota bacterium]|nr:Jag N-terminal domain-containing protein [Chloroflexota bacterium]
MESVEASGKTIEDAILQALARLGRTRDEVEVVVLQEPSRGARGMGVREAR